MLKDVDNYELVAVAGKRSKGGSDIRRLTREDWIRAARRVLVRSGFDDVKVDRLARQMKVTRGSFYWHFRGFQDLADALLHDWESRNQAEIADIRIRWSRSTPNMVDVFAIWAEEQSDFLAFDMAIRVWARKSASVASAARRVDDAWIAVLKEIFVTEGYDKIDSFVRARIAYFTQIGYYALAIEEELPDRLKLARAYYRALVGKEPDERLDVFLERYTGATAKGRRSTGAKSSRAAA
jgi:AcrR family transcriptional regulator